MKKWKQVLYGSMVEKDFEPFFLFLIALFGKILEKVNVATEWYYTTEP